MKEKYSQIYKTLIYLYIWTENLTIYLKCNLPVSQSWNRIFILSISDIFLSNLQPLPMNNKHRIKYLKPASYMKI